MIYELTLTVIINNLDDFLKVILPESGKKDRSEIAIKKDKGKITIKISAADSIALKSSVNAILNVLTIYEKTKTMVDKND